MQGGVRNLVDVERHFDPSCPVVTVVIVTYQAANTLRETIQSVLHQGYSNLELVVVDGGSSDGTLQILKDFDRRVDFWISEGDRGVYDAMNKGIRYGTGDWYYFLGADDTLTEGFGHMIGRLRDVATIYYGDVWMPARGIRYDGKFSPFKLSVRNICHQSLFYPRLTWRNHRYETKYPVMADYALNLECFGDPLLRLEHVPERIAVFNDDVGLSQTKRDIEFEADKLGIIKNNFPRRIYLAALVWHWLSGLLKQAGLFRFGWHLKMALKRQYQRR
jgi:glycosyltransferase involved in cell wall biosynthesis